MKSRYLLFSFLAFLGSCTEQLTEPQNCPDLICTQEFRSVTVKFKDTSGNPLVVKNFSAVVKRTGKSTDSGPVDTVHSKGNYSVVTDNYRKNLAVNGDTIIVSAVNPASNEKKTVQFVVSGGKCACHIEKLSGPDEVVLD